MCKVLAITSMLFVKHFELDFCIKTVHKVLHIILTQGKATWISLGKMSQWDDTVVEKKKKSTTLTTPLLRPLFLEHLLIASCK